MSRVLFNACALIIISFFIHKVQLIEEFIGEDLMALQDNITTLHRSTRETDVDDSPINSIRFSVPNLIVQHNVNGIDVELHAFKINNQDRDNEWVSIGEPILVKNRNGSIYEFVPESILFQLQLLADDQRAALLNAA
uniref:Uncharacterized protein n=1 Tax=Romanomermis culicivorax TaxID=13658 RepID=A0A915IFT9_ROMCU